MNQTSHLPLKLNMSGVIPPIFASIADHVPGHGREHVQTNSNGRCSFALQGLTKALAPGRAAAHAAVRRC